jgi:hypothetical protein
MTKLFKYSLSKRANISEGSNVNVDAPLPCLVLLLSGLVDAEHFSGQRLTSTTNYFYQDLRDSTISTYSELSKLIAEDLEIKDFNFYLTKHKHSHFNFFKPLLDEIAFCLFLMESDKFTSAFIHLYRSLEAISFAFPAIYIASSNDFSKSYKYFQDFFKENGTDAGELAFFRSFVSKALNGDPVVDSTIDYNFTVDSDEISNSIISEIIRTMDSKIVLDYDQASKCLSVKFSDVCPFIISLRNRYFHNSNSGIKNMQIDKIIDPEILFKAVTKKSIFCVATILIIIIQNQMKMLRL